MNSTNEARSIKVDFSTMGIRKRQATAALVAATAAILSNAGTTEAFAVDSNTVRGPLHLNYVIGSGNGIAESMLGYAKGAAGSSSTRLHALTEPEVLLKDLFDQKRKNKVASSKLMKTTNNKANGNIKKHRKRKDGPRKAETSVISMRMEDLYRLESSFDLDMDVTDVRRSKVDQKQIKRTNSKVEKLKKTTSKLGTSRLKATPASASIAPPRDKINTLPSPRQNTMRPANGHSKQKRTHARTSRIPKQPYSRSSTMPGFLNNKTSQRHQAFRDGLSIAKNSNNRQVAAKIQTALNSKDAVKRRRKTSSEAMYNGSASVPDSLIAFTNEIHQETRITPKEEVELGTKTQKAIEIQNVYSDLERRLGREPTDGEWCAAAGKINMETLNTVLEEGLEAKQRLVTSNLRMVQGVVNLYIRNGLGSQYNAGDLMQDGTAALIRAAEKFEPSRGFRFSTYAMYWIRAAVKRSQILQSRVINVPQRLHETHKKISKIESELKKELGRKPHKKELATAVGITEAQLDRCLKAMSQKCFSLDAEIENTLNPNKGTSKETMYNILSAQYDNVEHKQIQSGFMKDDLVGTLRRYLSPHEVDLLLLRYGLMDERTMPYGFSGPLTIAEVSRLVGLKPDKVRRIINKCLRQLRHLIAHEWEDFERELS